MSRPIFPQSSEVAEAHTRISEWVRETPVIRLKGPGARPMVLKLECLQRSGSFKLRGALNKLLSLDRAERKRGVITASGGNHGLGVAWAGWLLGVPVQVVAPSRTPRIKRDLLASANAELTLVEGGYPEADALAREKAERLGLAYVHAYDDADVIVGQGTVVAEMIEQEPRVGTVVVSVGGGGLAAGVALGAGLDGTDRRVIGVEPEGIPTLHSALAAGEPVALERIDSVAADSLGAGRTGDIVFPVCRDNLHRVELVDDAALNAARQWLWDHVRIAAEHGAVAGLAALMQGRFDDDPGPIGLIICGANTDPGDLVERDGPGVLPEVPGVPSTSVSGPPEQGAQLSARRTVFATSDNLFRALGEADPPDASEDGNG